jgi:lipoprotein-anchoring transpeptidase ErfK/SrfK
MKRALLSACLLFTASAILATSPAVAGSRLVVRGDPIIDGQWAAQLRLPPMMGNPRPQIDLSGRRPDIALPARYVPRVTVGVATKVAPVRPRQIDPAYLPAVVDYRSSERAGTIVIDPRSRYLYLILEGGKAQRYGVGVGRDGFGWSGSVKVGRKAEWPTWTPPAEMRKRQPYLPVSMKGGPSNPLGARALYLYDGGRDTLFRIHGSNEPWTIGQAVSSGCFRMRNEDVTELYGRVGVGTRVVVL